MARDLTIKTLENIRPGTARREIPDGHTRGLYFVMQPSGTASWAVRYRFKGKPRKMTLGPYPAVALKPARELASAALAAVAKGDDPGAEKQEAKRKAAPARDLIENLVPVFIERHAKQKNRPTHATETERILKREIAGPWKGRQLSGITRADIHELLDGIVDRGAPIQANRTLCAFRKMCAWAVDRGIVDTSPCQGVKAPSAERSRDRVLTNAEIKTAWAAFEAAGWPFGFLAQFLLLTAARRDEGAQATWAEINLDNRVWTIPAARVKNSQEHSIPLSEPAAELLCKLPRIDGRPGFVFTTTGKSAVSGFSRAKRLFDELAAADTGEALPPWRLHDLRRTAASSMTALGIAPHVVDAVLNHKSGAIKGVSAVYMRYSYAAEKREALDKWADFLTTLMREGNTA
jgi:integrase